jgi:Immunity protein 8
MMRAEVKRWMSLDLPDGKSLPEDPTHCCLGMQADIGPVGEDSADTFSFEVCTPSGLASRLDRDARPYWGRGMLVVGAFSWDAVEAALDQFVRSVSGDDWAEVAEKLNRFMQWEFEDYQAHEGE